MSSWANLRSELTAWSDAGKHVRFWLRDDDAVEWSPALARLFGLTNPHRVPVALAVVPAFCRNNLTVALDATDTDVLVHGYAHANHAPRSSRKVEFGGERSIGTMLNEAIAGLVRLRQLFADRVLPVFVPPWNRAAPLVIARLAAAGYRGYSALGPATIAAAQGLCEVNADIDIINWKQRQFAGTEDVLTRLVAALRIRRQEEVSAAPVGLLTHHLVHDELAWRFLQTLFEESFSPGQVSWVSARAAFANEK